MATTTSSPTSSISPEILKQINQTVQEKNTQTATSSSMPAQPQSSFPKSELDEKILHPQPQAGNAQVQRAFLGKTFVLWKTADGQPILTVYPTIQLAGIIALFAILIITGIGIRRVIQRKKKRAKLPHVKRLAL